jgi:c-di-GMP-binding flagellar brake protein YcgR
MPEGKIFSEKRAHKRVSKKNTVAFEIISSPSKIKKTRKLKERKIADYFNISAGGIGIVTDEDIFPEQIIEIEFVLEGKDKPVTAYARVKSSNYDDKINKCRAGIEFLAIKEKDKDLIKNILKKS